MPVAVICIATIVCDENCGDGYPGPFRAVKATTERKRRCRVHTNLGAKKVSAPRYALIYQRVKGERYGCK